MKHDVQHEIELRRYLLGELALEEQVLVEQRLFLDSDYAELQEVVEDDLIDQYLADELKGKDRINFVNHFLLLPEHNADLKIAEALKKYLSTDDNRSPQTGATNTDDDQRTPWFFFSFFNKRMVWLSLAVAALVLLSIITWMAFRSTRGPAAEAPLQAGEPQPPQNRPDESRQPSPLPNNDQRPETAQKGDTNGPVVRPNNSGKPPERSAPTRSMAYVIFAGGAIRGGGATKTLDIPADTTDVELRLPLEFPEPYDMYRADLFSGERRIRRWFSLKSQSDETYGPIVSVSVSVDLLREQSYRIKLHPMPSDQQPADPPFTYHFNVERK